MKIGLQFFITGLGRHIPLFLKNFIDYCMFTISNIKYETPNLIFVVEFHTYYIHFPPYYTSITMFLRLNYVGRTNKNKEKCMTIRFTLKMVPKSGRSYQFN